MQQISRRQLLSLSALLLPLSSGASATQPASASPLTLISAVSDPQQGHWVLAGELQQDQFTPLYRQALPGRGHHVAVSPRHGVFIAVARRPGSWLVLGDSSTGEILQTLELPTGRHLYGHGVFAADETRFYTTESDYRDMQGNSGLVCEWLLEERQGRLQLQRGREFVTAGVGPHELLLMPDRRTLAVANGGMRTHPDSEREVLNADTMLPSLVYLDTVDGSILEQLFLPDELHQCSIRHMDVNAEGLVAMGMQYQGELFDEVPLFATHQRGQPLRLLTAPPPVNGQLQQYVGSVRFSTDGRYFAASSPRGNTLTIWDARQGSFHSSLRSRDGCGLYAIDQGFVFSSGVGRVSAVNLASGQVTDYPLPDSLQVFWDNHLSAVAGNPA